MLEDLKKLLDATDDIKKLLLNPEPGLSTWHWFIGNKCQAIFEILWAAGFRHK